MARICKPVLGLCVLLLAAGVAGCGGGGDSESSSVTTVATSVSVPTVTTAGQGFTQAQWTQYQQDAAAFKKQNTATLAKVQTCAKPVNPPPGAVEKCVGDSLTKLSSATSALGATLAGFANSVGGECQAALAGLINYVVPYEASIASLQNTISTSNYAAVANSVSAIQVGRANGQAANKAVEESCRP
jgi:hypothetical protein